MVDSPFQLITPADRADYRELIGPMSEACWPEFMLHDPIAAEYWGDLFERFPEYQFGLLDTETGRPAAKGNSLPLNWDGELNELPDSGWDWAFVQAVDDHIQGRPPHTHCAIEVSIHPDFRGQGLSGRMLQAMREIGHRNGLRQLIAPVRPSQKPLYPLADIDRYITWQTRDGLPLDAWLRVHVRAGGRIIKACHASMTIPGTIAEWERWTGMRFPESGRYIIPGALNPVAMNIETGEGIYVEPNVWTVHALA